MTRRADYRIFPMYPSNIQPPNILHNQVGILCLREGLYRYQCISELVIPNNKDEVVTWKVGKLNEK